MGDDTTRMLSPGTGVRVRVPASSANLGPGFDSVGVALGVWDEIEVTVTAGGGLVIDVEGEGADEVARDASHLVHRSLVSGFAQLGLPVPEHLHLLARGSIPHSRGLGSSASAIVAGVAAAHGLVAAAGAAGAPGACLAVDLELVADLASELEGHPDNATASVHGGLTVSWTLDPGGPRAGRTGTARVAVTPDLTAVVLVPSTRLATHTARAVLPSTVAHHEAAQQAGRAALLALAVTSRPDLLLPATRDWLHQEQRRSSFPLTMALVDALRAQGHAAVVSGAGPSVLVLTTTGDQGRVVVPAGSEGAWQRLAPGIPAAGVTVTTLEGTL
ncbi:MAG: homoserine kinase [Actinomycetota bacterium]|nr:homoserine kinase [Actinomycetota bacterium]